MDHAARRFRPAAEGVGFLVDLRGSIWTILSEVTTDAERIVLDPNTPSHEVPQIIRFINETKALSERLLGPVRNARPALVVRSIERLRLRCVNELTMAAERIDQALRRAKGLSNRKRAIRSQAVELGAVEVSVKFQTTPADDDALAADG